MANYESGDNDLEFLDDEDDVKGDIETRMAMALHNQEYARQMSMEERRATALKSVRRDPYGSAYNVSSGGQGDRDLYDSYMNNTRSNPPRPKTGYKSNYAVDSSHYLDDSNYA